MLYLRSFIFNIVCYSTLTVGCIFNSLVGLVSPKATIKNMELYFYSLFGLESETSCRNRN